MTNETDPALTFTPPAPHVGASEPEGRQERDDEEDDLAADFEKGSDATITVVFNASEEQRVEAEPGSQETPSEAPRYCSRCGCIVNALVSRDASPGIALRTPVPPRWPVHRNKRTRIVR